MLRRISEPPVWLERDRLGDRMVSTPRNGRRLSLWFGEFLLIAIIMFGFVMLSSAIFSEPRAVPERVALKGHTQVVEAWPFHLTGACSRRADGTIRCGSGIWVA